MGSNEHNLIEILAPAGSIESMKAAFYAGADAVYMGGSRFGARAFADNPQEEDLKRAIDYAHIHGKKLYLTMNTLFKERELEEEAFSFLKPYYEEGLDGIIIQDLGLLNLLKESFPKLPIHGSTQMTITGKDMAKWLENQGLERIVLSRELSLDEMKQIRKSTSMEIEVFVQGALCYCYSGQCLMSSFIGGRSGNRGRCAQPCRLPYQVGKGADADYILSPKDICTLKDIPDLVDSGVNSYKIEGRMKKPEYAAMTAWLYRHYVDHYLNVGRDNYRVDPKDMERLMDLYNRGGFSGGYLHQHNHAQMIFRERPNHMGVPVAKVSKKNTIITETNLNSGDVLEIRGKDGKAQLQWTLSKEVNTGKNLDIPVKEERKKPGQNRGASKENKVKAAPRLQPGTTIYRVRNQHLIDEMRETYLSQDLKEKILGWMHVYKDAPVVLTLEWKEHTVTVEGDMAQAAKNQPMTEEQLKKPVLKTGNTPFVFESLHVETDGECYVQNSVLNDLRRQAISELEKACLESFERHDAIIPKASPSKYSVASDTPMKLHILLSGPKMLEQGKMFADFECVDQVTMELHEAVMNDFQVAKHLKMNGKTVYFALPSIFREKDRNKIVSYMAKAKNYADGWLVRQIELALLVKTFDPDAKMILDASVYNMNKRTKEFLKQSFDAVLTAPVELNYNELKALNCSDMELVVYGHQTLMVSAQCVQKNHASCTKRPEMLSLTDRQHKNFYVYNECDFCYNKIYNGLPTILFDKKKEIQNLNPASVRMHFTMESPSMMRHLVLSYEQIYSGQMPEKSILKEFTRGHFSRGIE